MQKVGPRSKLRFPALYLQQLTIPHVKHGLVLTPIFEADLQAEQYAYREGRSALDAVRHVHRLANTGHGEIVDGDL